MKRYGPGFFLQKIEFDFGSCDCSTLCGMMDGDAFIAGLQAEEGCCRLVLDDTELKIETVESPALGSDTAGNCASGWTKEDTMSFYSSVVLQIPDTIIIATILMSLFAE